MSERNVNPETNTEVLLTKWKYFRLNGNMNSKISPQVAMIGGGNQADTVFILLGIVAGR